MAFPAVLKLDEDTHARFREYCAEHGYIMAKLASRVLDEYMDAHPAEKKPAGQETIPDAEKTA